MKITTKTGDKGQSSLFGGRRVSKSDPYMQALGDLDELHSFLGFAKFGIEKKRQALYWPALERVQDDVYRIMAIVGFEMKVPKSIEAIDEEDTEFLEKEMEKFKTDMGDLDKFIRTGTSEGAARFNVARSVCRRAERSLVELGGDEEIIRYINRLSDLLFVFGYSMESSIAKM